MWVHVNMLELVARDPCTWRRDQPDHQMRIVKCTFTKQRKIGIQILELPYPSFNCLVGFKELDVKVAWSYCAILVQGSWFD